MALPLSRTRYRNDTRMRPHQKYCLICLGQTRLILLSQSRDISSAEAVRKPTDFKMPNTWCSDLPAYPPICTASRQASYLGSQKRSQNWCLTIVRHQFWDRQAPVLGSSGTSFGIVRHQFWDLTLIFRVQKGAETV